jgi:group I intron endonuclease
MYYTIYKITNKINGNFYIGKHKTKNLYDKYMGSGKLIQAAIKKHGIENFEKEILETFNTEEEMNEAEKHYVVLGEGSYNLCPGGQGGWGYVNTNNLGGTLGLKHKEEDKKQIALSVQKYMTSDDEIRYRLTNWCLENGNGMSGKKHSIDTKQKMSGPRGKYNVEKTGIKRGPYKKENKNNIPV